MGVYRKSIRLGSRVTANISSQLKVSSGFAVQVHNVALASPVQTLLLLFIGGYPIYCLRGRMVGVTRLARLRRGVPSSTSLPYLDARTNRSDMAK